MSIIETTISSRAALPLQIGFRLRDAVRSSFLGLAFAIRVRRTARQLNELSDWELKDIGLSRSVIQHAARDAAHRHTALRGA